MLQDIWVYGIELTSCSTSEERGSLRRQEIECSLVSMAQVQE